jgi:hypothetical protein
VSGELNAIMSKSLNFLNSLNLLNSINLINFGSFRLCAFETFIGQPYSLSPR